MKTKLLYIVVFFEILVSGCGHSESPVPEVSVDFYIYLNDARFSSLQNPGGWCYVTGGYNGIFVYNFDCTTYYAYDRACPESKKHTALIYNEKTHCLCHTDTVSNCNSQYSVLLQGAVQSGSSKYPLKRYLVRKEGDKLHVVNEYYYLDY
ncbi:MAG: hypothetical protein J5826_00825 [Bacteroidales bacterium]|nr:hypothetical protein [Bacteroidales bacterium]